MFSQLRDFARKLWTRLSHAANRLFRHILAPTQSNLVTGTLADIPRLRTELLAGGALCCASCENNRLCTEQFFIITLSNNCEIAIINPHHRGAWQKPQIGFGFDPCEGRSAPFGEQRF